MAYQIDQSGKIEQTNKDTVLALSNSEQRIILIRSRAKRIIQEWFKENGKLRFFTYFTFAALVAIIIKMQLPTKRIEIDREYLGHEDLILERITIYLKLLGLEKYPPIEWGHVGKTSKAHDLAAKVGSGKLKPNKIVRLSEIMKLLQEGTKNDRDLGNPRLRTT